MPKHRYDMDEARIQQWEKDGRGTGCGPDYKPWLQIHNVASYGRSSRTFGEKAQRVHHLLSDNERVVLLLLDQHEAVLDIREQFPLPRSATLRIAEEMRVRHPAYKGVDVVMTTDFLVDRRADDDVRKEAIAVKPAILLDDKRTLEKLEIERRYWLEQGVSWRITTDLEVSAGREMLALWIQGWTTLDHLETASPNYWDQQCAQFAALMTTDEARPLADLFKTLERAPGARPGDGLTVIRHMLATRRLRATGDDLDPRGATDQLRLLSAPPRAKAPALPRVRAA